MTGKGILEALSFVDEKYIEEAETGTIRRKLPVARVLLPLTACFCLVFSALLLMNPGKTTEQMAAEQEPAEGMPEIIVYEKADSAVSGGEDIAPEMEAPIWIENCEVPSVVLRIVQWTEEGFTATVEEIVDTDIFPVGTLLNVEIKETICIEFYSGDLVTVERRKPTDAEFPAGTLIRVQFDDYSLQDHSIRIEAISLEEE